MPLLLQLRFATARTLRPWLLVALVLALLAQQQGVSQTPGPAPVTVASESNLKLARLFATAKFILWPDEAGGTAAPFVIGIVAPDPFAGGLQKLAERKLRERPIQIVVMKSLDDYRSCHLLYLPSGAAPNLLREILERAASDPVLVWRDSAETIPAVGVSCTFVRQGDALLIETDPTELKRRGLVPDAQLLNLKLIRIVKPNHDAPH